MINYKKYFFGLFFSLLFVFPTIVLAAGTEGGTNESPLLTTLTCSTYQSTGFSVSSSNCEKVAAKLGGYCKNVEKVMDMDKKVCYVRASNCTGISCMQIDEYISAIDKSASEDKSNTPLASTAKMSNPISISSPQVLIGTVINAIMGIVGSIALLMFIFGGLTWMTSGGSAEKVKKGRDIIIWSAIGLVVIFSSYTLVRFLILNVK